MRWSLLFLVVCLIGSCGGDDEVRGTLNSGKGGENPTGKYPDKIELTGRFMVTPDIKERDFGESNLVIISGTISIQYRTPLSGSLSDFKFSNASSRNFASPMGSCQITLAEFEEKTENEASFVFWGWDSKAGPGACLKFANDVRSAGFQVGFDRTPIEGRGETSNVTIRVSP